jgi:hypothetical protein
MITNPEYNNVLTYWGINLNLKFEGANFYVVPDSDSGTWQIVYKAVCSSPVTWQDILFLLAMK